MAKKRKEVVVIRMIEHRDQRLYEIPDIDYENRNARVWIGGQMERLNDPNGRSFQAYHEGGTLRIVGEDYHGLYLTIGEKVTIIYEEDAS